MTTKRRSRSKARLQFVTEDVTTNGLIQHLDDESARWLRKKRKGERRRGFVITSSTESTTAPASTPVPPRSR